MHPSNIKFQSSLDLNSNIPTEDLFLQCCNACSKGLLEKVRGYIDNDRSLLAKKDDEGKTLAHVCAAHNQFAILTWICEQDPAMLDMSDPEGQTLLHYAVRSGCIEVIEWLYQARPQMIDRIDSKQISPLHIATFHHEKRVLKLFVEEIKKRPAIIQQIAVSSYLNNFVLLLEEKTCPDLENSAGQTLLHLASEAGQIENVRCLLRYGADIETCDKFSNTPLFFAIAGGHKEIVLLLIKEGANPAVVNAKGETLLHLASSDGRKDIIEILLSQSECKNLLNTKDHNGKTPLHNTLASIRPNPMLFHFLMECGAEVNLKDHDGNTPLHLAARWGHTLSAELLLQAGAKANTLNDKLEFPFDLAVSEKQKDFIRFFLGVPPDIYKETSPSKSIEDYYGLLLKAKDTGDAEEQILYLQFLSHECIMKNDFHNSAKILNCALALLLKLPGYREESRLSILGQYILDRLEQIEVMFLRSKGVDIVHTHSLVVYRNQLKEIRANCKEQVNKFPIQEVLSKLTQGFKSLLHTLIEDAQQVLGKPPIKWACIGMDSMSQDEMLPYSGVKFTFLIKNDAEEAAKYFSLLSQFLELRLINLGETQCSFGLYTSPRNGFSINTPNILPVNGKYSELNPDSIMGLVNTPAKLAQFLKVDLQNLISPSIMSHACLIGGDKGLLKEYTKEKENVHCLNKTIGNTKVKNHIIFSLRLLGELLKSYTPQPTKLKQSDEAFNIKHELLRPFQAMIACLALFYQIKEKSTFKKIDKLVILGIFKSEGAENLKKAITQVLTLCLQAHIFYDDEKELIYHPAKNHPLNKQLMYFNNELIETLQEIYTVLIPFYKCANNFYVTQNACEFNLSTFIPGSS